MNDLSHIRNVFVYLIIQRIGNSVLYFFIIKCEIKFSNEDKNVIDLKSIKTLLINVYNINVQSCKSNNIE